MALGTVGTSTLVSQIWQNTYDIIDANVSDSKDRTKWIYSAFPVERKRTEDMFPCIIIDGTSIDAEQFVMGNTKMYRWTVPISVFSKHMGTCDTISDDIVNQLNSNSGSFTTYGFYQPIIRVSSPTHTIIANQSLHERRIELIVEGAV